MSATGALLSSFPTDAPALDQLLEERRRLEREVADLHRRLEQEIAARERAERTLREAEDARRAQLAAERAAKVKDEVLSVVSHDLRTPLASLLGFTELMLDRDFPPDRQRALVEVVHKETRRMTDLLNDLLDIQALESGRIQYDIQPVDLGEVLKDTVEVFAARDSGRVLRLEAVDRLPAVRADRGRLQQALANLVSNAINYSPEASEIRLSARRVNGHAVVSVIDRGIGISEADRERVFEKFFRARSDVGEARGTGLGLAIVKRIVEDHRGEIRVESELGAGSTFSIALPLIDAPSELPWTVN